MSQTSSDPTLANNPGIADGTTEVQRKNAFVKAGALRHAILGSATFRSSAGRWNCSGTRDRCWCFRQHRPTWLLRTP
jgi:hypothetical protein